MKHTGHCYCGGVSFEVEVSAEAPPIFRSYCHCDDCRRSHAAPLYQVVAVDEDKFVVTQGDDLIKDAPQKKEGGTIRSFCGQCGTRIYNKFPSWKPKGRVATAWFPNTLDEGALSPMPELLRPYRTAFADECVLDVEFLKKFFDERDA
jgi:hypothetical protein